MCVYVYMNFLALLIGPRTIDSPVAASTFRSHILVSNYQSHKRLLREMINSGAGVGKI